METKKITIKRAIVLFWKGLTGIIAATAEWFTTILGMRDESRYGKFIRRVGRWKVCDTDVTVGWNCNIWLHRQHLLQVQNL